MVIKIKTSRDHYTPAPLVEITPSSSHLSSAELAASNEPALTLEHLKFTLKVKGVGLGITKAPCSPMREIYVDIVQTPTRIQWECSIGSEKDETQIVFSADQKEVVRVLRRQYLSPSDPETSEIISAAVKHYGKPSIFEEGNWYANYGDAYSISYEGKRANATISETDIGLLIKGFLCADKDFVLGENCNDLGRTAIKYDLINVDAFKSS